MKHEELDGKLPTLTLSLNLQTPRWRSKMGLGNYYSVQKVRCEVLTVHLAKNTMRVRFHHMGMTVTRDMSAGMFFEKYEIRQTKIDS